MISISGIAGSQRVFKILIDIAKLPAKSHLPSHLAMLFKFFIALHV